MFVVVDLDGTLALTEHRSHFLQREHKDWRGFYAACDKDEPCHPVIKAVLALWSDGHRVEIWTGRSKEVVLQTAIWLRDNALDMIPITMREEGDHRPDTVLKLEWLNKAAVKPDLVFEDRKQVVDMWRANGIVCCQVAPGEF